MKKWLLPFFETFMVFIFLGCCFAIPIILIKIYAASYFYIIEKTHMFDFLFSISKDDRFWVIVVMLLVPISPIWYFASKELFYQYEKNLIKFKKTSLGVTPQCPTYNFLGRIGYFKKIIIYKLIGRTYLFCRRILSILFVLFQTCMCLMAFIYFSESKNFNEVFHTSSESFIIHLVINYTLITYLTLKGMVRAEREIFT